MSEKIRVLVVDDHTIVREGIALMLEEQPEMEVAAEARNGREALEAYRKLRPTLVLMDLRLPVMDGFDTTRAIRALDGEAKILVLTTYAGDENVYRALEAGASGYLLKSATRDEMLSAIRAVCAGRRVVAPAVASRMAEELPRVQLTPRELDVLRLMARGRSNREIGAALAIAEGTVKVHAKQIFGRLGARDRTEAVLIALRRGLVHTTDDPV